MIQKKTINEFKSDIKAAYTTKRYAEKSSGSHKPGVAQTMNQAAKVVNDKGTYSKSVGAATTTAKDKKLHDVANAIGSKKLDAINAKSDKQREKNIKAAEAGKEIKKSSRDIDNRVDQAEKFANSKVGKAVGKAVAKLY